MAVARKKFRSQKGYLLLSVMLLMTLMLIALSVELPRISQQIMRTKEEELIHRGEEYKRAVRKFYRKFGRYPLSIEQLENTNNMRFLRKRFTDPMTGKADWRIVHQGEIVPVITGHGPTSITTTNGFNSPTPTPTPTPTPSGGTNPSGNPDGGNAGSAFGNSQPGGGPMAGVASIRKDLGIKIYREKEHYNEWIFYYSPQEEQQQLGDMNPNLIRPGPDKKGNTN